MLKTNVDNLQTTIQIQHNINEKNIKVFNAHNKITPTELIKCKYIISC